MYLLMAIFAALAYTTGGVFMKLSAGFSQMLPTLVVYILFFVGATLQIHLTNNAHLGITYILVLGLESGCALLLSHIVFKEPYSISAIVGISLIIIGTGFLRLEAS
jgi:small multidrug resistance pump/quaternary ammonium compound-resistance protein SugE